MKKLKNYLHESFRNDAMYKSELEYAITRGEGSETVKAWLRRVKDINAVLPINGMTALGLAIRQRNSSLVELLLNEGASTERNSDGQDTPLLSASSFGLLNAVKSLVEHGADITARTADGLTSLYLAARNRHLSVVSYLLEQESCPTDGTDEDGFTVLRHVVILNDPNLTSILIKKGLDINAQTHDGETPLFLATKNNCTDSLRELIASGADPKICAKDGESPFLKAVNYNNMDAIELLMTAGRDSKQEASHDGSELVAACSVGSLEAVKLLLERVADIEVRSSDGMPCVLVAAKNKHKAVVSYLLEQDFCPVDGVDENGYTLLHHVVLLNDPQAISNLIDKGLDIDAKTQSGETPVFLAVKHNCLASVKQLLESGADPNVKTKNGDSALEEAVNEGRVEMVMALVNHGADSTTFIQDGQSPVDLALEVAIARQQRNNPQPYIVQVADGQDKPTALETANEATELASNVVDIVTSLVG